MVAEATLLPALVKPFDAPTLLAGVLAPMCVECKTQRLVRIILCDTTLWEIKRLLSRILSTLTVLAFPASAPLGIALPRSRRRSDRSVQGS